MTLKVINNQYGQLS